MVLDLMSVALGSFGILGGLLGDIFGGTQKTNYGTDNAAGTVLSGDANSLNSLNSQQLNYEKGLEGQREQSINNEIQQFNPAGIQSNINSFGAGANERAGDSSREMGLLNASQGIGSGVTSGQTANAFSNAANATNQYAAQLNSPAARAQMLQQQIGAILSGQSSPAMSQELQLFNPLQQQSQFNNQLNQQGYAANNNFLGGLGGIVGGIAQSAFPGIGTLLSGGGLGSSGSSNSFSNMPTISQYTPGFGPPGPGNQQFGPVPLGGVIGGP